MPLLQNNGREPLTRERRQGIIFSILIHILFGVLVFTITFRIKVPEPVEEGLLVNFGFDETGDGLFEPASRPSTPPPPPPSSGDRGGEEALLTQNFEEAVEVEEKKPDPEELRREAEARAAEIRRQLEAEAEKKRIEEERAEQRRREEEQRLIAETRARTQNALARSDQAGTSGKSEGITGKEGNQGVETGEAGNRNYEPGGGQGDGKPRFDLAGRNPIGTLPLPQYNIQQDGVVIVEIWVDRTGKVTRAVAGARGSTTLDENLLRVAREAALKARFSESNDAPAEQKGTITYNFKLR